VNFYWNRRSTQSYGLSEQIKFAFFLVKPFSERCVRRSIMELPELVLSFLATFILPLEKRKGKQIIECSY
jgi:hypothetical protein